MRLCLTVLLATWALGVRSLQLPLRVPASYGASSLSGAVTVPHFPAPEQQLSALSTEEFTLLTHDRFKGYGVRIKQADGWCDEGVKAYTGYLDVDQGAKHLFFYFFESRTKPSTDPLLMWINGGPGCSSALGLLMELGPCRVNEHGNGTVPHPYAWNDKANVFFLDQPVGVGFSYADYGETVETTEDAAKNVAAFMWIFLETFSDFKGRQFHMAGESYGGRYLPVFASEIMDQNKRAPAAGLTPINLQSVMIGNGVTDYKAMIPSYYDMACTNASVYPILDISQCVRMKRALPRCMKMVQEGCEDVKDELACTAAMLFCGNEIEEPFFTSGMNPYDISRECDGPISETLCYPVTKKIGDYLNMNSTRKLLGIDNAVEKFSSCSNVVGAGFNRHLDIVAPGPYYISGLLERGVSILIYVGSYDWICNWVGNMRWVEEMEWHGQAAYNSVQVSKWFVDDEPAGITKSWRGLTYATVEGAGHMVPYDKPVQALEMVNRWLEKRSL